MAGFTARATFAEMTQPDVDASSQVGSGFELSPELPVVPVLLELWTQPKLMRESTKAREKE